MSDLMPIRTKDAAAKGLSEPQDLSVPGVLSHSEVVDTAAQIADLQVRSGRIPWFPGGHTDPWNHVECAMALDVAGLVEPADAAYDWLANTQLADGSWHHYYIDDGIEDNKFDANTIAYIAVGVWHRWLLRNDRAFLEKMWPVVDRALNWVIRLQRDAGDIIWARHSDGTPFSFSLLTGSSSISHSLRAGLAISAELGNSRPSWREAAERLVDCIANNRSAFAPKDRWAMDWYYPVLTGAIRGEEAVARLVAGHERFVMPGKGVRCVSDQDWITSAETCEYAMAYLAVGLRDRALELFEWAQVNRTADGSYYTGIAYPSEVHFPAGEKSSYTAAAVVLAADALNPTTPAARLLWDHSILPMVQSLSVSAPESSVAR